LRYCGCARYLHRGIAYAIGAIEDRADKGNLMYHQSLFHSVAVPEDMLATYRALRTAHVLAANAARAVRQRAASLWSPAPPKTVTVAKGCPSHPNNTPDGNSGVADGVRESPGGVSLVVSPRRWRGSVQTLHVRASTGQPPPSSPHCTRVSARFPRVLCRLTARGRAHAVHAGSLHQNPPAT
jgi:hypothetical protein